MAEDQHHRRHADGEGEAGIYIPSAREAPRPTPHPTPATPDPTGDSPWAPTPPEQFADEGHADAAPTEGERAADWMIHPTRWATTGGETSDEDEPAFPPLGSAPGHSDRPESAPPQPAPPPSWPVPQQRAWPPRQPPAATTPARSHPSRAVPPPRPPQRRPAGQLGWWVAAGAVVLAIAVIAGLLIGVNLAQRQPAPGAPGTACRGRPVLQVAATPEFAPVLEQAIKDINAQADGCKLVNVTAQEPAATLADLRSKPPEVWIPSSSAWLRLAAAPVSAPVTAGPSAGSASPAPPLFVDNPVSLARSPVVIAAPQPFAASLDWPEKQPTWATIAGGIIGRQIPRFSMESPVRGTAGLLAVLGVQTAIARTTTDPGIAQMRALTVRARLADPDADNAALLKRMGEQTDPAKAVQEVGLFPVTEQALWAHSRTTRQVTLAALYPPDGLLEADYPLALSTRITTDQTKRDLATRLSERIRSREFISSLTGHGLRPPAQTAAAVGTSAAIAPSAPGLMPQYPPPVSMPAQIAEPAAMWAQYKRLNYQTLLLVDGSGSMNDEVRDRSGRLTTKADLLRAAGIQAAQLFGEDTSLGMWLFGTPTADSPPFTVALPFGPINESVNGVPRREAMQRAAQSYKALPAAGTPLFETVLRGVADMRDRFRPDATTLVVVLTDGRDEDSRFAMSRQQFLARLNDLRDPARPVPVFSIGYGSDADMGVLNDMARATGGRAVASNDPGDLASAMAKIFLAAHQPR